MKLVRIEEADGCTEGNIGYDFCFDSEIGMKFSDYIGKLGKYIFIRSFDKPYGKVIVRGYYTLKWSLGNKSIRMIVPETISKEMLDEFANYVNNYID